MSSFRIGLLVVWGVLSICTQALAWRARYADWYREPRHSYAFAAAVQLGGFVFGSAGALLADVETLFAVFVTLGYLLLAGVAVVSVPFHLRRMWSASSAERRFAGALVLGALLALALPFS